MEAYEILNTLGEGSYGQAHLALKADTNSRCVIKEIKVSHLSSKDLDDAKKEVKVLSSLVHENITKFHDSFEANGSMFIVMEYCAGGDLHSLIENRNGIYFPETRILDWFVQLCLAVRFIHQKHIIHRDIKTQNIFLTQEGRVKLGDFGIAKILDKTSDLAETCVGTPFYLSPEMCENKPYSNKSDIWAVGCVLYEMASLKHAFDASNMKLLILKIIKCSYQPLPPRYSRDLRLLIQQIFQKDPKCRPSVTSILSKPFLMKKLPKYISQEDSEELKITRRKYNMKPKTSVNAHKISTVRSRIGVSSPAAKYSTPNWYKEHPSVCIPSDKVKSNPRGKQNYSQPCRLKSPQKYTNSKIKSSLNNYSPSQHERTVKQKKHGPLEAKRKPNANKMFLNKHSTPILNSSPAANKKNTFIQKTPYAKARPLKFDLIMHENLSSFKNINVSNSIYKNLDMIEKTTNSSHIPDDSGWLIDLYLSKKLITLNKNTAANTDRSNNYVDKILTEINQGKYVTNDLQNSHQHQNFCNKFNDLVNDELDQINDNAQIKREASYSTEMNSKDLNNVDKLHDTSVCVVYSHDMICINDGTYNMHDSKFEEMHHLSPIRKRLSWFPVSSPLTTYKQPLSTTTSEINPGRMKGVNFALKNRKQWGNDPRNSIVKILSSAKLLDGTINPNPELEIQTENSVKTCKRFKENVTQNSNLISCAPEQKHSFSTHLEINLNSGSPRAISRNSSCDSMLKESDNNTLSDEDSLLEDKEEKHDVQNMSNQSISLPPNMNLDNTFKSVISDEEHNKSVDASLKRKRRRFFSFLQKSKRNSNELPCLNIKNSVSQDRIKTKSRFSGMFKKLLNCSNDKSKQKAIKYAQENKNTYIQDSHSKICNDSSSEIPSQSKLDRKDSFVSDCHVLLENKSPSKGGKKSECNFVITSQGVETPTNILSKSESYTNNQNNNYAPDITYISGLEFHVNEVPKHEETSLEAKSIYDDSNVTLVNSNENYENETLIFNDSIRSIAEDLVGNVIEQAVDKLDNKCRSQYSENKIGTKNKYLLQNSYESEKNKTNIPKKSKLNHKEYINQSEHSCINSTQLSNESSLTRKTTDINYNHTFSSSIVVSPNLLEKIKNKVTPGTFLRSDDTVQFRAVSPNVQVISMDTFSTSNDVIRESPIVAWSSNEIEITENEGESSDFEPRSSKFPSEKDVENVPFFYKRPANTFNISSSKSSLSDEEVEEVENFRKSLEDLLSCDNDMHDGTGSNTSGTFERSGELPDNVDGDVHGWIEEQRAFFEQVLGLETFIEAYRCLECAYEQNNSDFEEALNHVKEILGETNRDLASSILQLIVTESIHLN